MRQSRRSPARAEWALVERLAEEQHRPAALTRPGERLVVPMLSATSWSRRRRHSAWPEEQVVATTDQPRAVRASPTCKHRWSLRACLARTYLTDPRSGARLFRTSSVRSRRRETAAHLDEQMPRWLRRAFPRTRWDPALSSVRSPIPATGYIGTVTGFGPTARQRGDTTTRPWPVEQTPGSAAVPGPTRFCSIGSATLAAFAAMKTACMGRSTRRQGSLRSARSPVPVALTREAAELVKAATAVSVTRDSYYGRRDPRTEQLAHQARLLPTAEEVSDQVRVLTTTASIGHRPYDPFE